MSPAHPKLEIVLDPTVKDRAPPPTSWSMQDYTNPQSCFRTFCYFSAHALPTLLFPIFSQNVFCTCNNNNNVESGRNHALIIRPRSTLLQRLIAKWRHACRTSSGRNIILYCTDIHSSTSTAYNV